LHLRFRGVIALASATITASGLVVGTPAASAAPQGSTIAGLQAQAAAIETQLAAANAQSQIEASRFDAANAEYAQATAQLAKLKVQLDADRVREHAAMVKVQQTAVASYVFGDSTAAQYGAMLAKGVADIGTVSAYAGAVTGSLHSALVTLQHATIAVAASESTQRATVARARGDVVAAESARSHALALATQQRTTLSQVKGSLASVLAEQARIAAAAAARRAEAARIARQAAALAAAQQEAQAAAAIAASAASASPDDTTSADATAAAASASSATATSVVSVGSSGATTPGAIALATAQSYLGVPYVWGGASSSGLDCSGLTMLAWRAAGVSLLHNAYLQYKATTRIALSNLQPGDLLFYYFIGDGIGPVTHVAMYAGNNMVIQAPETGQSVSYHALYTFGLVGVGRPGG
jgi:cell wall-associated NlpC family hydrolase